MDNSIPVKLPFQAADVITLANLKDQRRLVQQIITSRKKASQSKTKDSQREDIVYNVNIKNALDTLIDYFETK